MNSLFFLALLVVGLASALPKRKFHPLSDEAIAEINEKQSTWKAGRNFEIEEYEVFKTLANGVKKTQKLLRDHRIMIHDESIDIPEHFDSSEAWPECADIINLVRDQSRCGACWAFAAVEGMSDRICIHSNATRKVLISAQDLLTCIGIGGCDGGYPTLAWAFWQQGIVSGGLYNHTEQGCKSYFLPPCEDHPHKCTDYVETPKCLHACDNTALSYEEKTFGGEPYVVIGEKQIQLEIMNNGPVEATMYVYADFANYQSGIYQQTTDELEGAHAVLIKGWGIENRIKYWLVQNSWNERWGENGHFRIIRGRDEVGIESNIDAALPDFSKF